LPRRGGPSRGRGMITIHTEKTGVWIFGSGGRGGLVSVKFERIIGRVRYDPPSEKD